MEAITWNNWINRINNSSTDEIDIEISAIESDETTPYVEKNLKLGFLYYSKDFLGTATNIFKKMTDKIEAEKNNFEFIQANQKGINILQMGWIIQGDGCGGIECIEETFCGSCCGPFCCCFGVVACMAICGIEADSVCSYDSYSGESGGCCGNACTACCNGCAPCCGDDTHYT